MRSRSVAVAILFALLFAGGAVGSFFQAQKYRTEARWLLERGTAQAQQYAQTLDGTAADEQLSTLEQRREVLESAHLWQRLQLLCILASVIAAFSSYVFFLFRRLREQLLEGADASMYQVPPDVPQGQHRDPNAVAAL